MKEYCLMYLFGAWVTKSKLYSESDEEAIFDADKEFRNSNLSEWKYSVALWQGNRIVKYYKHG